MEHWEKMPTILYMICDITIVSRPQQGSHFVQGLVSPISLFV